MKAHRTPVLECKNVSISYYTRAGEVPAVYDFNLTSIPAKRSASSANRAAASRPSRSPSCNIWARTAPSPAARSGSSAATCAPCREEELRQIRGSQISMVYQEPMASLNPSMLVKDQLIEVPMIHEGISADGRLQARGRNCSRRCGCPIPQRIMNSYPHQLSGGQQQRVVIAMALLSNPKLLLLDEPTTALDVTVEAGVVELIKDISKRFGTSMIYISHNLGLILETCDRICVMYSGPGGRTRHASSRCSTTCAIPIRAACSPRSRCRAPTAMRIRWCRSAASCPCRASGRTGCTFGPRCDLLRRRALRHSRSRCSISRAIPAMRRAACAMTRSTGSSIKPQGRRDSSRSTPGQPVLQVRDMKKYYEIRDNSLAGDVLAQADRALSRPMRSSTSKRARPRPSRSSASRAAARRLSPRC